MEFPTKKIISWLSARWKLAAAIWILQLAGYTWVLFSVVVGFLPASSGAVLVCVSVFCELTFDRLKWRGYLRPPHNDDIWLSDGSYQTSSGFSFDYVQEFWPLIQVATSVADRKKGDRMIVKKCGRFYERIIRYIIGFSAVFGTLIWGYMDWLLGRLQQI